MTRTTIALVGVVALAATGCSGTPIETEAVPTTSAAGQATAASTPTAATTAGSSPTAVAATGGTGSASGGGAGSGTASGDGATSNPSPTATDTLDRTSITLDASGHLFTETPVAVPRSSTSGSCPIPPPGNASIIACTTANAEGGGIGVTVEENGSKFYATIWKSASGSTWDPVTQTPIYTRGDGGSGSTPEPNQIVPEATEHTLGFNVIDVGFEMGGSGAFWDHQVVDWDQGDADPQVAYTIARPSPTVLWQAGKMVVDAPHLADGDANCCPTEREVVVVERPDGRTSVPGASTIVPRGEDTPELLAAEVYRAWLDGSIGAVPSSRLASAARSYLNSNPSGGQDVHGLAQATCPWNGTHYACEFGSTGNTMTWRIEPSPAGTHQLVEIVEGAP